MKLIQFFFLFDIFTEFSIFLLNIKLNFIVFQYFSLCFFNITYIQNLFVINSDYEISMLFSLVGLNQRDYFSNDNINGYSTFFEKRIFIKTLIFFFFSNSGNQVWYSELMDFCLIRLDTYLKLCFQEYFQRSSMVYYYYGYLPILEEYFLFDFSRVFLTTEINFFEKCWFKKIISCYKESFYDVDFFFRYSDVESSLSIFFELDKILQQILLKNFNILNRFFTWEFSGYFNNVRLEISNPIYDFILLNFVERTVRINTIESNDLNIAFFIEVCKVFVLTSLEIFFFLVRQVSIFSSVGSFIKIVIEQCFFFFNNHIVFFSLILLFCSFVYLYFLKNTIIIIFFSKKFSLIVSVVTLVLLLIHFYLVIYKNDFNYFSILSFNNFEISILGYDIISFFFILLTAFIFPICFLLIWNIFVEVKLLCILLLLMEFCLFGLFLSMDFLLFYVFFEILLIPMMLFIIFWGSRQRKIKAMYYFFLYTLFSSLFFLISILILFYIFGTTNFFELYLCKFLYYNEFTQISFLLWPLIFFSLAVKIPMFPFHIWLPEAHVEAPTVGSVILAALLLKIGGYGIIRFLLIFFGEVTVYYQTFVYTLCVLGIIYCSFMLFRQIDLKKLIAYSSITHMNFALLGLFANTSEGLLGGVYLLIAHGFSSGALFILIGNLYDRFHTRLIFNYTGLIQVMPKFSFFFFFFTLCNFGFPGTANFMSELIVFSSLIELDFFILLLSGFSIIFSVVYSLLVFVRVCFGQLSRFFVESDLKFDLSVREICILCYLAFNALFWGLTSNMITTSLFLNIFLFIF
jgi:proton-translocating NADH-quinone oxidoreductase chain M